MRSPEKPAYTSVEESFVSTSEQVQPSDSFACPRWAATWQFVTGLSTLVLIMIIISVLATLNKHATPARDERDIRVTYPLVSNTWPWREATTAGFEVLRSQHALFTNTSERTHRRLNGLVATLSSCEVRMCDHTVGWDGSPDSTGRVSLDAMVFDGPTWDSGAVGFLQYSPHAAAIARDVMIYTAESILTGSGADRFARLMGYAPQNLTGSWANRTHADWVRHECQPNFWRHVSGQGTCGPYIPIPDALPGGDYPPSSELQGALQSHGAEQLEVRAETDVPIGRIRDTISAIVVDEVGDISVGTSSNGARNKLSGRMGDAPIPGAGAYVDNAIGAAVATGDGDVMMRFAPAALAVEGMRHGSSATQACVDALDRIGSVFPKFTGGMVCFNKKRQTIGGASFGWGFTFAYQFGNGSAEIATPPTS